MVRFLVSSFFLVFILFTNLHAYELGIAAIFQNEAPYLQEWIEYHRMVGVEHFWLYNDRSRDDWEEVLEPYIDEGLVEIIDWPVPSYSQFIQFQCKAYNDAIKRTTGVTKWLALIDIDEFLLPTFERTVTECLSNHFQSADAMYINWYHFGTGGQTLAPGESLLFTQTTASHPKHFLNKIGKSIVRPDKCLEGALWHPHFAILKPGGNYLHGHQKKFRCNKNGDPTSTVVPHFLRINHYTFRDENFFHHVKLARMKKIGLNPSWIFGRYNEFNNAHIHNFDIQKFILEKHPNMWDKYWKFHIYQ